MNSRFETLFLISNARVPIVVHLELENHLKIMGDWFSNAGLKLNEGKTEVLGIKLNKNILGVSRQTDRSKKSLCSQNVLDVSLTFYQHTAAVTSMSYFNKRKLQQVKRFLSQENRIMLVRQLILS